MKHENGDEFNGDSVVHFQHGNTFWECNENKMGMTWGYNEDPMGINSKTVRGEKHLRKRKLF